MQLLARAKATPLHPPLGVTRPIMGTAAPLSWRLPSAPTAIPDTVDSPVGSRHGIHLASPPWDHPTHRQGAREERQPCAPTQQHHGEDSSILHPTSSHIGPGIPVTETPCRSGTWPYCV